MDNPWLKSLDITATPQQLLPLMAALDPAWNNTPRAVTYVQVQLDPGSSSAKLYIGNADVSTTNCGVELSAGESGPNAMSVHGNPISLASIWLLASTPVVANVVVVQA